ncbi:MAG: OFA family MFS transporter [Acidobacteria bacterium]|nr:OFA family MFS transporter [Acidobacteriota bacterium]
MKESGGNRWRFVAAALVMQLCLGVLYSWSVFRGPLEMLHGWTREQSIAPYRYSLLFFTIAMVIAGFWQDKKGPRLVGSVGGVLLAAGCLLSAWIGDTPGGLIVAYGVLGGLGVGFAYVTPIATCVKWFPDKRGMIVGLAVMGFGAGSLIFAPLLESLIGSDASLYAQSIPKTFMVMSAVFFVFVIGAAQVYRVPPAGWKPEGWNPPAPAGGAVSKVDYTPGEMLKTWQFYALWVLYALGASVGLVAIGQASPLVREMAAGGAALTGGAALGVMSAFNGLGRLGWGSLSDKLGRKATAVTMFCVHLVACLFFLRTASSFWPLLIGLCLVGFAFGGYLALLPSFTADYFGPRNIGANYGLMFSAYGLSGYFVPGYFAGIMEQARSAGDLAGGYNQVYVTLAVGAAIGMVLALLVRKPQTN